jgi:hypothetical protein
MRRTPIPGSIGSPQRSRMRSVAETNSPARRRRIRTAIGCRCGLSSVARRARARAGHNRAIALQPTDRTKSLLGRHSLTEFIKGSDVDKRRKLLSPFLFHPDIPGASVSVRQSGCRGGRGVELGHDRVSIGEKISHRRDQGVRRRAPPLLALTAKFPSCLLRSTHGREL